MCCTPVIPQDVQVQHVWKHVYKGHFLQETMQVVGKCQRGFLLRQYDSKVSGNTCIKTFYKSSIKIKNENKHFTLYCIYIGLRGK